MHRDCLENAGVVPFRRECVTCTYVPPGRRSCTMALTNISVALPQRICLPLSTLHQLLNLKYSSVWRFTFSSRLFHLFTLLSCFTSISIFVQASGLLHISSSALGESTWNSCIQTCLFEFMLRSCWGVFHCRIQFISPCLLVQAGGSVTPLNGKAVASG